MTSHWETAPDRERVRVWFGDHVIAAYVSDVEHAERYEKAIRRRFVGLRITREPVRLHDTSNP